MDLVTGAVVAALLHPGGPRRLQQPAGDAAAGAGQPGQYPRRPPRSRTQPVESKRWRETRATTATKRRRSTNLGRRRALTQVSDSLAILILYIVPRIAVHIFLDTI